MAQFISVLTPLESVAPVPTQPKTKKIIGVIVCAMVLVILWVLLWRHPWIASIGTLIVIVFCLSEIIGDGKQKRKDIMKRIAGDLAAEKFVVRLQTVKDNLVYYEDGTIALGYVADLSFATSDANFRNEIALFCESIKVPFNLYVYSAPVPSLTDDLAFLAQYKDEQIKRERFEYLVGFQDLLEEENRAFRVLILLKGNITQLRTITDAAERVSRTCKYFKDFRKATYEDLCDTVMLKCPIETLVQSRYAEAVVNDITVVKEE